MDTYLHIWERDKSRIKLHITNFSGLISVYLLNKFNISYLEWSGKDKLLWISGLTLLLFLSSNKNNTC